MIITRTSRFKKDFQKLPQRIQEQTIQKLRLLVTNIKHPSLRVKKVQGTNDEFELSITMNYRAKFRIETDSYVLMRVGTHNEILRR